MMRRRGRPIARMAVSTAVIAGTAGAVRHHQDQKYANQAAQQEAEQAQQYAPAPEAAAAPEVDPTTAQLQNLANLHAQGILSDEEFAAAKAKALGI
jgi:Short C-terminal domain